MATIPTATIIPGPKYTITPTAALQANGLFMLGNSDPDNIRVGAYAIEFRMDVAWQGEIGILARSGIHKAGVDDAALLGAWPFRAFYLNGQGWDGSMLSDAAWRNGGVKPTITSTSSILVPAAGQTIGLAVQCTAGSCLMYYVPLLGQSAM